MQSSSECVILGCPLSLCVKLSADQNHRIDSHRCKPGGKSKTTHLQTCFDPQATDGHLSSYIHTPPIYVSSHCLLLWVWSLLFFIPPSFFALSFPLPCIFDHCGLKPIGGRSLTLDFYICACFIECLCSKYFGPVGVYGCLCVFSIYVCLRALPGRKLVTCSVFKWKKLRLCYKQLYPLCNLVSELLSISQYWCNHYSVTSSE